MADNNRVSLTEAKQRLGELVKRAAYGGERFVLEFREKPQAAIVSYADLKQLEERKDAKEAKALVRLKKLREQIARETGIEFDSAEDIARLREERTNELSGLR